MTDTTTYMANGRRRKPSVSHKSMNSDLAGKMSKYATSISEGMAADIFDEADVNIMIPPQTSGSTCPQSLTPIDGNSPNGHLTPINHKGIKMSMPIAN